MRYLFIILAFLPLALQAQTGSRTEIVGGQIFMPALQSIKVEMIPDAPLDFNKPQDFSETRLLPGFCKVTVISNVPWVINVSATNAFLTTTDGRGSKKIPISDFSIRGNMSSQFVPLSTTPTTILRSDNDKIINTYFLDLQVNSSYKPEKGDYKVNIVFSISPE